MRVASLPAIDAAEQPFARGEGLEVLREKWPGPFRDSDDPRYPWVVAAKTRASFTMVKRDGVWKIAHFQNTTVDLDAEKNDPITWDETGFLPGGK